MRVSGIAIKQRETEAKALKLFVASSLIGSLFFHVGLLASGVLNMNVQVPEAENRQIELTFIDPPVPEETKEPPKPEPPKPEPPKPEPQQLEETTPPIPDPETITDTLSDSGGTSGNNGVPEISDFKPKIPQNPIVPETPSRKIPQAPKPKVEQIEPQKPIQPSPQATKVLQKPIQPPPQVTKLPQKAVSQTPTQKPQITQKTNEDLQRLLTQREKDSRRQRVFSPDSLPTQAPEATQADSEKLRGILTKQKNLTENSSSSSSDSSNSSPNIAANSGTSSPRRRRSFGGNNEVATAPTTPNPAGTGTGSGTGDSTGDGDGSAACRQCDTSYPYWAKRQGIEGEIVVSIDTDPQGNVTNVRLLSSSGNSRLDKQHLKLARKWKLKSSSNGRQGVRIITNYVLR